MWGRPHPSATSGQACGGAVERSSTASLTPSVTLFPMPGKRAFEEQVAALEALRHEAEKPRLDGLRKALKNRNNFIVGKAADLVRELAVSDLTPDLLAAYDRF